MSAEDFEVLRQHMLAEISAGTFHVSGLIGKATLDERVMTAMGKVPRHEFVPIELQPYAYAPGRRGGCPPRPPQTRTCRFPASGSSRESFAQVAYRWMIRGCGRGRRARNALKRAQVSRFDRVRRSNHLRQIFATCWRYLCNCRPFPVMP